MSRRNVLRGAAVVGGAAAAVPLFPSLSEAATGYPVAPAHTTAAQTKVPSVPNANGYQTLVPGPGEPWTVRNVDGTPASGDTSSDRGGRNPLLAFAQFSDIHVVDHQSPGRVEWLDRFEDPNAQGLNPGLLSSSYRPHEMLTAHVAESMVLALNALSAAPVTGLPLAFMVETGDNSDNCQKNEVRWNIDILDGDKTIRPDSGNVNKYEGVMDNNTLYYDTHYWHPDGSPAPSVPTSTASSTGSRPSSDCSTRLGARSPPPGWTSPGTRSSATTTA